MKKIIIFLVFTGLIALPALALAAVKSELKRPNLAKAQWCIDKASERITEAQKVNEFDLGGHAAKAKTHLESASSELKLAEFAAGVEAEGLFKEEEAILKNFTLTESQRKHPNLAKAQLLIETAQQRITAAQNANEFDMGGHAAKAKSHLEEAIKEVKLAAEQAGSKK